MTFDLTAMNKIKAVNNTLVKKKGKINILIKVYKKKIVVTK
jgi:hypothetical protein